MSKIELFDKFYGNLSEEEKETLLEHIISNYITESLLEGFFAGPVGKLSQENICSKCGRKL